jgi:proline iminopeptidase
MAGPFPPIEPYDSGMLDAGDQHHVYWECCGNPTGKPALFLHGGPGSGCSAGQRRFFDPSLYNAVLSINAARVAADRWQATLTPISAPTRHSI